jgi:hypothetical protein
LLNLAANINLIVPIQEFLVLGGCS